MKHRIGIIGGGQLGRMLGFAAKQMGFTVTVIDPTPNSPAGQVVDRQIVADYKDETAIRQLAAGSDYLTFEIELADAAILDDISAEGVQVNPSAKTLTIIKDKFLQKQWLAQANIPTANHRAVQTVADIEQAATIFEYPLLLKARFDAYDGRGNALIRKKADIPKAIKKLSGRSLYVEQFVTFEKELAVMVARSTTGEIRTYPVVETIHKNNICHTVIAPAQIPAAIQRKAKQLATRTMQKLQGAGVFGIEMFFTNTGAVLVNEIAPRVHNSGHYTIEACVTSQFEQHIRAIAGLPLGSTEMVQPAAVMVNILGTSNNPSQMVGLNKALSLRNVAVHLYGKADTKLERKMGHITVTGTDVKTAYNRARRARNYIHV